MFKNRVFKNILSALAVIFFGFILLNLTFLLNFLFFSLIELLIPQHLTETGDWQWFPPARHVLFLVIIGLISWPILKSRLRTLLKAIYLVVPVAVTLVTVGLLLNTLPLLSYLICALLSLATLVYLYLTRRPWLYYFAVIIVAFSLLVFNLMGGEI